MDNTGTSPQLKLLLADFVLGLESASDVQACFDLLAKTSETLGFSGLVYTSIATGVAPLEARGPLFSVLTGSVTRFLAIIRKRILPVRISPSNGSWMMIFRP
ncbi:hypothetical protein [Aliamphritea spongicola]|nr:hypothetical protein [Aliamphritea spongicola]